MKNQYLIVLITILTLTLLNTCNGFRQPQIIKNTTKVITKSNKTQMDSLEGRIMGYIDGTQSDLSDSIKVMIQKEIKKALYIEKLADEKHLSYEEIKDLYDALD